MLFLQMDAWPEFDKRRKDKYTKQMDMQVMGSTSGFDEGADVEQWQRWWPAVFHIQSVLSSCNLEESTNRCAYGERNGAQIWMIVILLVSDTLIR